MLNPALYQLILLQGRGMVRRTTRGAGTLKRVLFFSIGALVFILWLLSGVVGAMRRSDPARVRLVMPLAILGICIVTAVTSAGDKAIAFTPGEVDQLFPGPFSRRELLGYKLLKSALMAVITGLILSIALLRHAQWWFACFVGVFLALLFVQFFSIAAVLAGQTVGVHAYNRARRIIMILLVAAGIVAVRTWMDVGQRGTGAGHGSIETVVYELRTSRVGHVVFAPLESFGNAMTARTIGELAQPVVLSILLIAIMVALVVLLDANYLEAAMTASQRRYEKIQRIRAGSFLSGVGVGKNAARWRVPPLPWLGGAGPIAWRQLTNAFRSSRGLLLLLLIIGISAAPILLAGGAHKERLVGPAIGLAVWLTFFASSMLNFDFRGDVDQMDTLKALPIGSIAVTLGQLVAPVLVMAGLHILVLGAVALSIPQRAPMLGAAAILVIPFDLLLFCAENLVFLLFPSRPAAASPGDLQVLGRKFVFLLMKGLVLTVGGVIAMGFAVLAWVLTGRSLVALTVVGFVTLLLECAALVPLIALAYRKFDPAIDTPA